MADPCHRQPTMPPIASPVPLKPQLLSPLLLSSSASTSPPSTATSASISSSSSPDYYDSPPSPPLSLEDQVHVAYAHDDIHTAKILLLRLKGIEVTDDNDPRIAEVQDEDFDFCFAPNGGLIMDAQDEKAIQERQRIELERMAERRRQEHLRMCEMKWEREKRRLREERKEVLRRKEMKRQEEEQRRRRRAEQERARLAEEEERRRYREEDIFRRRTRSRSARRVVNYHLPSSSSPPNYGWSDDDECDGSGSSSFVYDFMTLPSRKQPSTSSNDDNLPLRSRSYNDMPSTSRYPSHHRDCTSLDFDDSQSIPFTDVLKSMHGQLFPVTNEERRARARRKASPSPSTSRPRTHSQIRRMREDELIQILLDGKEDTAFSNKGKAKAIPRPRRQSSSAESCTACKRSPSLSSIDSLSPTPTSPSSAGSRLSWLTFRSSSSFTSSASSLATTPPTSPRSSGWFSLVDKPRSRRASWVSTTSSPIEEYEPCRCSQKALISIDISESPLTLPVAASASPACSPHITTVHHRRRQTVSTSLSGAGAAKDLVQAISSTVSSSVFTLLELVHGFQQACVTAAKFSVAHSVDGAQWEERKFVFEEKEGCVRVVEGYGERRGVVSKPSSRCMKPHGYRVSAKDVAAFLAVDGEGEKGEPVLSSSPSQDVEAPAVATRTQSGSPFVDIPLSSPYGIQAAPEPPRHTVLPNPLPYKLYFKPIPPPTRSPFRFNAFSHLHTTYPDRRSHSEGAAGGAGEYWSNPDGDVQLPAWRIRSVGNPVHLRLMALQNVVWQKGLIWEGRGREMGLGGGRDRVVGVAYEGVGCSRLGRRVA
ncbi:hypothetical protein CC1G_00534 [Coprinopsis cinerea okayama7|uniref:Uncharacterized protein n=1 Tax=Coprinopsis cinerea (strain Okayama-7 / 130 / ATCC MYA-4618 / FGSC 9003) TaxID=240176 RepID=A8N3B0_COPC7|nr:hypothetical protein CC1G_00534 [Coprinopsis cinerea okayama7\|eukprot:XP_001829355.2 hypothetical protein CC1G_00534 [Coprinopsis cinerea okayama7\